MRRMRAIRRMCRVATSPALKVFKTVRSRLFFRHNYLTFRLPYFWSPAYDRMEAGELWEPDLSQALFAELSKIGKSSPVVFDVGANVGFIALNILSRLPDAVIHAFEPAPFQGAILEGIARLNRLTSLYRHDVAIGERVATSTFITHAGVDASGLDGLIDTRAEPGGRSIQVKVDTLDSQWASLGKPHVDLLKLDTEGAELLALRGAVELVKKCRPVMAVEIWPSHLDVYPYSLLDLLQWLDEAGYRLERLSGQRVFASEDPAFGVEVNFIARPNTEIAVAAI